MVMEDPDVLDGEEEVGVVPLEDREELAELLPRDHHEEHRDLGRRPSRPGQPGDPVPEPADMFHEGLRVPGTDDPDDDVPQADPVLDLHTGDGADAVARDVRDDGRDVRQVREDEAGGEEPYGHLADADGGGEVGVAPGDIHGPYRLKGGLDDPGDEDDRGNGEEKTGQRLLQPRG